MMGSSIAWFLANNADFSGSVLVVERDMTYAQASTSHTNSCMRQQFSHALNIKISQFAAEYVKNFRVWMGGDERVPELPIRSFGYMYLADTVEKAGAFRAALAVQKAAGAATELMTPQEIERLYPFYNVEDVVLGSHNRIDEGLWDGQAVFDWWRRSARERGIEYVSNAVVAMRKSHNGRRVESLSLQTGEEISCGYVVNASGPRAVLTARMAGIDIPVEPRKRYSWIFSAEKPLDRDLPLTIDPTGVHVRENGGGTYLAGGHNAIDAAVNYDDFEMDQSIWQDRIWPVLAARIPQFEAIKVTSEWAGHYAYNTLDHNAIVGRHSDIANFLFCNGFSGHGLQQSPAMGRGLSELIAYGEFRTLDLAPFGYDRIAANRPILETAVI